MGICIYASCQHAVESATPSTPWVSISRRIRFSISSSPSSNDGQGPLLSSDPDGGSVFWSGCCNSSEGQKSFFWRLLSWERFPLLGGWIWSGEWRAQLAIELLEERVDLVGSLSGVEAYYWHLGSLLLLPAVVQGDGSSGLPYILEASVGRRVVGKATVPSWAGERGSFENAAMAWDIQNKVKKRFLMMGAGFVGCNWDGDQLRNRILKISIIYMYKYRGRWSNIFFAIGSLNVQHMRELRVEEWNRYADFVWLSDIIILFFCSCFWSYLNRATAVHDLY